MLKKTGMISGVAAAALLLLSIAPTAAAAEPETTPSATASPTASPSPSEPSASATPAPSASSTPAPSATPDPSATPSATDADPALAVMNRERNHSMGSTIPQDDSDSGKKASLFKAAAAVSGVLGMDVSGWQTNVNWPQQYANGARFAYVKATEDLDYTSSQFSQQYTGSYSAGLIRGAYHFATPNTSSGAAQATFFYKNGGGWAPDGRTLPPLLDIEYDPYTATDHTNMCWGLSPAQMTAWIQSFVTTLRSLTGINPAIYSTTDWWNTCTGSSNTFGAYPLFIARYSSSVGSMPASWLTWTIWQYADSGTFPGDQDVFNGTMTQLQQYALGASNRPPLGAYDTATISSGQPLKITGWAFDATNLGAAVTVQVDWSTPAGRTRTTVVANGSRPDVGAVYPAAGPNHGYSAQTPWAGPGQYGACVTAIAQPTNKAGNASLGCKTAFLSAATSTPPASQRVAGSDRFGTAVALSQLRYPDPGVKVVYIASGADFPDALAAAPAAASQQGPVLLTQPTALPAATLAEVKRLAPQQIIVVGSPGAVSDGVYNQLATLGAPMKRLGGADRYETARLIAAYAFPSATTAYIATGAGFADALSAGPSAAKAKAPLLLVRGTSLDAATAAFLSSRSIKKVVVAGSPAVVSDTWAQQARTHGVTVTRYGGADRYETSSLLTTAAFGADSSPDVYLASGMNWPDALVAAASAGSVPEPLLLSKTSCVPRVTGDQFVRLGTTTMKVVGGPSALGTGVDSLAVCF